jgi:hypothetical protein
MSDEREHAVVRQDELIDERRRFPVASSGGSLGPRRTFFPGDDISAAGRVHPGDTVCFNTAGGAAFHAIPEPQK